MPIRVRIKTWEEMEQEFGLDTCGDINVSGYFTSHMEELMPRDRIIEIGSCLFKDGDRKQFRRGFWRPPGSGDFGYVITAPMVAEYNPQPFTYLIKNMGFKKTASLDEI